MGVFRVRTAAIGGGVARESGCGRVVSMVIIILLLALALVTVFSTVSRLNVSRVNHVTESLARFVVGDLRS